MRVVCPGCQKAFNARDDLAGRRVKCPSCGGPIAIPGLQDEALQDEALQDEPPPRQRANDDETTASRPAGRRRPDDEDDERRRPGDKDRDDDRPAPPEGGSPGGLFAAKGLNGRSLAFVFAGVALVIVLAV